MAAPTPEQIEQLWQIHNGDERRRELLLRAYGFDTTRSWVDPNGYRLSDRIWRSRRAVRDQIDLLLRQAIARGTDGLEVARMLEEFLNPELAPTRNLLGRLIRNQKPAIVTRSPGRGGMGSFSARRLARTEITRAHGMATIETAKRTPFAKGVKWNLSGSHPRSDPCDENSRRDEYRLGPGVYPPEKVPQYPNHPQCLCNLSTATEGDVDAVVDRLREQYSLGADETVESTTAFVPAPTLEQALSDARSGGYEIRGVTDVGIANAINHAAADAIRAGINPVNVRWDPQMRQTAARSLFGEIQLGGAKTYRGMVKAITRDDRWSVSARANDPVASMIRHEYGHQAALSGNQTSRAYEAYRAFSNLYLTPQQRAARIRAGIDDLGWTVEDMPDYVRGYSNDKTIISEGWAELFASQGDPAVWDWPPSVRALIEEFADVFGH